MDEFQVTYDEVRQWAIWLQVFTPSMLADSMGVNDEVGRKCVKALLWHGICEDTGDELEEQYGPEPIISYVPLPPGPNEHETETPPEILVPRMMGGDPLRVVRGAPVRLRDERQERQIGSIPGARRKLKDRNRAWDRMQEAIEKRKIEQQKKARAAA